MVNTKKVFARMKEKEITQQDLAEKLGLARPTVSQKLRNVRPMFLDEAEKISDVLDIKPIDFGSYFFAR